MYEKIKQTYKDICLLNFILLLILFIFLSITKDQLLFKTDFLTATHFILSFNFLLLICLMLPWLLFISVLKFIAKQNVHFLTCKIVLFLISYGFLLNTLEFPLFLSIHIFSNFYIRQISAIIISIIIAFFFTDVLISKRISNFGNFILPISFFYVVATSTFNYLSRSYTSNEKIKNVIFFVLDGFPTQHIKEYNPKGHLSITTITDNFLLYTNVRTNYTYTSDYFKTLYSGYKGKVSNHSNLLKILQQNGINTSWMTFHTNGIPETNGINDYKGLRSFLITHNLSWIPQLFSIDYNIDYIPRKKDGYFVHKVHKIIKKLYNNKLNSTEDVLCEIDRLRNDKQPFFFLVHTNKAFNTRRSKQLWKDVEIKNNADEVNKKIRKNNYRYTKDDTWLIQQWRVEKKQATMNGFSAIRQILKTLKEKNWIDDTIIVITADHGSILSKGKTWYGFHNDEEVSRVPFIVINYKKNGVDNRLAETIDITQTIIDFFNIDSVLNKNSNSLLNEPINKTISTLTTFSKVRNEQFMNIYKKEYDDIIKYVVNLNKKNTCTKYILNNYLEDFDSEFKLENNSIQNDFNRAIKEYGLQ